MTKQFTSFTELATELGVLLSSNHVSHISHDPTWGSISSTRKDGSSFARTYWYLDDTDSIYFDMLSVSERSRKNGYANELLDAHLYMAARYSLESWLFCLKDSWMFEWYKRRNYWNVKDCDSLECAVWMRTKPM